MTLNFIEMSLEQLIQQFEQIEQSEQSEQSLCNNSTISKNNNSTNINKFNVIHKKYSNYNLFTLENTNKLSIYDQNTFELICSIPNNVTTNSTNSIKFLDDLKQWKNIETTKYYAKSKNIYLFHHNQKIFILYSKIIKLIETFDNILNYDNTIIFFFKFLKTKNIVNIENDLFLGFINANDFNHNFVYNFSIKNSKPKKYYDSTNLINDKELIISSIIEKKSNVIFTDVDYNSDKSDKSDNSDKSIVECATNKFGNIINYVKFEKKIYFSCVNELTTSLNVLNNESMSTKILYCCGYCVKIFNASRTFYKPIIINTDIYNHIINCLPNHTNQYVNYLELYQKDKLTEILPYLHKYPTSVIKRINKSVRTLAKEILNIYHLTRKKQNSQLYESLPNIYRSVLFNLHKIYVNQKYDYKFSTNNKNSDVDNLDNLYDIDLIDDMKEKISISVDIVYTHLKNMNNSELIELFELRNKLIKKLNDINYDFSNILTVHDINIITQIELMFSNQNIF